LGLCISAVWNGGCGHLFLLFVFLPFLLQDFVVCIVFQIRNHRLIWLQFFLYLQCVTIRDSWKDNIANTILSQQLIDEFINVREFKPSFSVLNFDFPIIAKQRFKILEAIHTGTN